MMCHLLNEDCPKNVVVGGLHANHVPAATRDLMVQRNQLDIVYSRRSLAFLIGDANALKSLKNT